MTSAELKSPATSASPGNEPPAASVVNLSKRFSTDVPAVDDVSLDVRKGVIFGLLGPNGARISMTLTGVDRKTIVAALANTGIGVETIEARHRLEDAFLGIVEKAEP